LSGRGPSLSARGRSLPRRGPGLSARERSFTRRGPVSPRKGPGTKPQTSGTNTQTSKISARGPLFSARGPHSSARGPVFPPLSDPPPRSPPAPEPPPAEIPGRRRISLENGEFEPRRHEGHEGSPLHPQLATDNSQLLLPPQMVRMNTDQRGGTFGGRGEGKGLRLRPRRDRPG
jgi:hypothetical protein